MSEEFERLRGEAETMASLGFDDPDFVVETLRRTWTDEEREELALYALRQLALSWVKTATKDSDQAYTESLKEAARRNMQQRVEALDLKTRMRALWEDEVAPYRKAGEPVDVIMRRLALRETDDLGKHAGKPRTPELQEYLATPAGQEMHRKLMLRQERRYRADRAQHLREKAIIRAVRKQEREAQWFRDLLDQRFVTPTGQAVSWGSATLDQHNQRIEVLNRSALSSIETMKRHEQAVRDLIAADATCLNDLVEVNA